MRDLSCPALCCRSTPNIAVTAVKKAQLKKVLSPLTISRQTIHHDDGGNNSTRTACMSSTRRRTFASGHACMQNSRATRSLTPPPHAHAMPEHSKAAPRHEERKGRLRGGESWVGVHRTGPNNSSRIAARYSCYGGALRARHGGLAAVQLPVQQRKVRGLRRGTCANSTGDCPSSTDKLVDHTDVEAHRRRAMPRAPLHSNRHALPTPIPTSAHNNGRRFSISKKCNKLLQETPREAAESHRHKIYCLRIVRNRTGNAVLESNGGGKGRGTRLVPAHPAGTQSRDGTWFHPSPSSRRPAAPHTA